MQHRVLQGEQTICGSPSRCWLTKRSSCVLADWPQEGHSRPRSSHWGSGLRSIGRQWQRKQASFILWRWGSADRDQSTTLTLINSCIEERLQETLWMHMWNCVVVGFLSSLFKCLFDLCFHFRGWWSLSSCQLFLCLFSCGCPSCYLPVLSVCTKQSAAVEAKSKTSDCVLQRALQQRPNRHAVLSTSGLLRNVQTYPTV